MRVLLTGGFGFVGRHLAKHLVECGDDVCVTYMPGMNLDPAPWEIPLPRSVQSIGLDVTDQSTVEQVVTLLKPEAVYHLAALASVSDALGRPDEVWQVNFEGTKHLLNSLRVHCPGSRVLLVSSSEVYGLPRPGSLPLQETAELRPIHGYGFSKAAADILGFQMFAQYGLHVIRARPFPHIGPGQTDKFAISSFARQLSLIRLEKAEPQLMVGDLSVKRDYSDVSDIVRGYREALLNGRPGEAYNFCSGQSRELSELVKTLIEVSGLEVEVSVDPARLRPVDVPEAVGSYQKAQREFGWKPHIDLKASLGGVYSHWLETLSSEAGK